MWYVLEDLSLHHSVRFETLTQLSFVLHIFLILCSSPLGIGAYAKEAMLVENTREAR